MNEIRSWSVYDWLIICIAFLLLSLAANIYAIFNSLKEPAKQENIDTSRYKAQILKLKSKMDKTKLEQAPAQINKIIYKYEKIHDTILRYTPEQVNSSYSSELRFYQNSRAAFDVKRFRRP